jgi:RepB DNA-primase from phage plasmid
MNTQIAQEFLTRCFRPGETVAILLRKENPASATQRIVRLEQIVSPRYLAWLRYENHSGANVYFAANPLRPGSRKRTKESIAEVRHLYLDIDVDGGDRIATIQASHAVPIPSAILSTSPDKYQALWRVEGFLFDQQESTLKLLALAFGGDSACTDRNRVLRVPGFRNCKYQPAQPVTVEYPATRIYNPEDFRLADSVIESSVLSREVVRAYPIGKNSHSEQDWQWVVRQLSLGEDARKLTVALASRRSDKPNPLYYAQRTIDIASARLSLLEGMAIDVVIAMLERRRSTEIPPALCSSRAREIVTTARRMIARNKFTSIHASKENHNATA